MKKTLGLFAIALSLVAGAPAFAATDSTAVIACVGTAVNARETAIGTAITTHTQAISAAYTARAAALQQAYTGTTQIQVRASVKAAWTSFRTAKASANAAWKKSKDSAWTTFKNAARVCKAPASISDAMNASSEIANQ